MATILIVQCELGEECIPDPCNADGCSNTVPKANHPLVDDGGPTMLPACSQSCAVKIMIREALKA